MALVGQGWWRIGNRFELSGTWINRNGEIKAAKKQRPIALANIEPIGSSQVNYIFAISSDN